MEIRAQKVANVPAGKFRLALMRPLFRIFDELRPHMKLVAVNQLVCLTALGMGLLIPLGLKYLTQQLQKGNVDVLIWVPLIGFFVLSGFALLQLLRSIISQFISVKIAQNLQKRILAFYLKGDISQYFKQAMGERVSRMTYDIQWFVDGAAIFLAETLYLPLVIVGCISIMFYLDWRIALIAIVLSPLSLLANKPFSRRLKKSSVDLQTHNAVLSRHIVDTMKGMLLVKVYAREKLENRRFAQLLETFVNLQVTNNVWAGLFKAAISIGNGLVLSLVCWFAFYLLSSSRYPPTIATMVAFFSILLYFFSEITRIGSIMNTLVKASVSCERIFSLLDQDDGDDLDKGLKPAKFSNNMVFKDVHFSYGPTPVLQGINFELQRGENIALMGMSGAGKTTLITLMLGLIEPQKGKITMDGQDLRDTNSESLRNLFSYSPQQNVLFFMTIGDNIGFSKPGATREEIERAAKIACAHEFILKLPQGYDTLLGEEGGDLSEGQRQRLALARAILRDAPIIILDESSAHVDLITERQIYKNIMSLPEKTVIIVSHRASVLKEAKTIYSIADGRMIKVGSLEDLEKRLGHEELLKAMEFIH